MFGLYSGRQRCHQTLVTRAASVLEVRDRGATLRLGGGGGHLVFIILEVLGGGGTCPPAPLTPRSLEVAIS